MAIKVRKVRFSARRTDLGNEVYLEGVYLSPKESQKVYNHSPDGFEWGYMGSGPAQLALAIMLWYNKKEFALQHYQNYKREVISAIPREGIENGEIEIWEKL